MTEAFRALIEYGFKEMGLHRIQSMVEPDNTGSHRLLAKFGFTKEGVHRHATFVFGEFRDLVMYSLLAGEFQA